MKKSLKVILSVIIVVAVLVVAGVILYKPVYNYVAPKIFDEFVAKNLDKLIASDEVEENENKDNTEIKTDEKTEEKTDPESISGNEEEKEADKVTKKPENKSKASANSPLNENNKDGIYKTKTTVGVYTETDLAYLIRVISPADKTRIITILKSCVAAADYPDMARRVGDGLDNADMAYIESYLRARMTIPQKQEILDIVKKYI